MWCSVITTQDAKVNIRVEAEADGDGYATRIMVPILAISRKRRLYTLARGLKRTVYRIVVWGPIVVWWLNIYSEH